MRARNEIVALTESQPPVIAPTNPRGALDYGIEDGLHVRRRAADDAEHLGGCRLMLQGLPEFCVAFLQFCEQPHVLNGDHCLIGEDFKEFNLAVSERSQLLSANQNRPDRNAFTKQRCNQNGPDTGVRSQNSFRKFGLDLLARYVMNVDGLSVEHCFAYRPTSGHRPNFLATWDRH